MIGAVLWGWTPLALASMGALWTELAGTLCVCVEGFIALGGFSAYTVYRLIGPEAAAFIPIAAAFVPIAAAASAAMALCGLCGFLLSRAIHALRLNPFVAGLAFNLIAEGFCAIASRRLFNGAGVLRLTGVTRFAAAGLPQFAAGSTQFAAGGGGAAAFMPGAAAFMPGRAVFFAMAVCAVLLSAACLRWTTAGRRLRAAGLSAQAAREHGLLPEHLFFASWALAGILAAAAGAAMLFRLGAYVPYGAAGRGWLALAAVFMGFKRPLLVAAAAFVFAGASVASSAAAGGAAAAAGGAAAGGAASGVSGAASGVAGGAASGAAAGGIPEPLLPAVPFFFAFVLYVFSCAALRHRGKAFP